MNLLELVQTRGLGPRKVSSVNGGEYHSSCPGCGGKDRFSIHLGKNRYFCRKCRKTGDAIQFLREFEGKSFVDAAAHVGKSNRSLVPFISFSECDRRRWKERAADFVDESHTALLHNKVALEVVYHRGINLNTIKQNKLGWNQVDRWHDSEDWGFRKEKRIYLPAGIVIPGQENEEIFKVKIRRSNWLPSDQLPKYLEIRGSSSKALLFGKDVSQPTMIMESELDAILMVQVAGGICNFAALGGATKRPDTELRTFLSNCPFLFFSLDCDEAGISAFKWWNSSFPRVKIWMPPIGKSPGDAYLLGIDLKKWVQIGIEKNRIRNCF